MTTETSSMNSRQEIVDELIRRAADPNDSYNGGHEDHIPEPEDEGPKLLSATPRTAVSKWLPGVDRTAETSDRGTAIRKTRMAVLHHAAMTSLDGLIALQQPGGREVSSNEAIKDNDRVGTVPFPYRAWSLADAYWDTAAATAECCNSSTGGSWPLSDETHESIAHMVAEAAQRDGWWPHRDGDPDTWTVIGHREVFTIHGGSYATACPGGMDLERITKRAQEIINNEGDDTMIARRTINSSESTKVGDKNWQHLYINKDHDVSLSIGPSRVDVVANIQAKDLKEGDVVQLKFVRVVPEDNDRAASEGAALELPYNGGSSFGQLSGIIDLAPGERLRIWAIAYAGGRQVTIDWTADLREQKL